MPIYIWLPVLTSCYWIGSLSDEYLAIFIVILIIWLIIAAIADVIYTNQLEEAKEEAVAVATQNLLTVKLHGELDKQNIELEQAFWAHAQLMHELVESIPTLLTEIDALEEELAFNIKAKAILDEMIKNIEEHVSEVEPEVNIGEITETSTKTLDKKLTL